MTKVIEVNFKERIKASKLEKEILESCSLIVPGNISYAKSMKVMREAHTKYIEYLILLSQSSLTKSETERRRKLSNIFYSTMNKYYVIQEEYQQTQKGIRYSIGS